MVNDHSGTRHSSGHHTGLVFPFGAKLGRMSESAFNLGDFSAPVIPNHRLQKSSIIAAHTTTSQLASTDPALVRPAGCP